MENMKFIAASMIVGALPDGRAIDDITLMREASKLASGNNTHIHGDFTPAALAEIEDWEVESIGQFAVRNIGHQPMKQSI